MQEVCYSAFIGRTVAKQLDRQSACKGTVVDFKAAKFTIQYNDNTTAALTVTQLNKISTPV